jgi:hypothetical protein
MRKLLLIFLVAAPALAALAPLRAQSVNPGIRIVPPQQCVWHDGDDPRWAAANLDESGWQPLAAWKLPTTPHYWIRCHADLSWLRTLAQPSLAIYHNTAFQVYLNGALAGTNGNPATGFARVYSYLIFPVEVSQFAGFPSAAGRASSIAIRAFLRIPAPALPDTELHVLAGDAEALREHRDSLALAGEANWLAVAIGFGVIGVAGFVFFGLYCFDRSRRDLLVLAIVCWGLSGGRGIVEMLIAAHIGLWSWQYSVLFLVTFIGTHSTAFCAYWLNRRRVPLFYKIVTALCMLNFLYEFYALLPPLDAAYGYDLLELRTGNFFILCSCILSSAFIAAFLPWRTVAPQRRPLAICCFLWGTVDLVFLIPMLLSDLNPSMQPIFDQIHPLLLEVRSIGIITTIVALVVLIFRDQQRTARERAELAGEMQAARAVQQVIVPEAIPSVQGFNLESVYKPAGEVGGDFFQIIATPEGGVLAVIGDVSGKGMPAAMTVSLLVGTFRTLAHYTQSPGEILRAMNQRMLARSHGGFTTCLVLRTDRDGKLIVANAGHLAPYLNGREMKVENGLPLGLTADANYTESTITLTLGSQLTLLSDGVVEARNLTGELFGFERTASISTEPAEKIAQAAQQFGQEDDITVLTLTRVDATPETALASAHSALFSGPVKP